VVELAGSGLPEQNWIGKILCIGDRLRVRLTEPTERCVMVNNAQSELRDDPEILRELAQRNAACFGVYAEILEAGTVKIGDGVTLI
jgi:hypothetical protein